MSTNQRDEWDVALEGFDKRHRAALYLTAGERHACNQQTQGVRNLEKRLRVVRRDIPDRIQAIHSAMQALLPQFAGKTVTDATLRAFLDMAHDARSLSAMIANVQAYENELRSALDTFEAEWGERLDDAQKGAMVI